PAPPPSTPSAPRPPMSSAPPSGPASAPPPPSPGCRPTATSHTLRRHRPHPKMGDVLRIRRDLVEAMVAHARRDHPDEACGILAGAEGSDRPERFIEMTNAERSPTRYLFDGDEFLKVYRELDANDEEVVVIYHSHTA